VVDLGRLSWDSPALPLLGAADVALLVAAAGLEGIDAVQARRDRLPSLPGLRNPPLLVLVGDLPCPAKEIARVVGLPVAGVLPIDTKGAAVLAGRARPGWGWTRLGLLRAARALALSLHNTPVVPPDAPAVASRTGAVPVFRNPAAVPGTAGARPNSNRLEV
jgi:hypothetical protein